MQQVDSCFEFTPFKDCFHWHLTSAKLNKSFLPEIKCSSTCRQASAVRGISVIDDLLRV